MAAMSNQSLNEALARLHAELQGSPQLDAESRRLLEAVGADIGRARGDTGHVSRLEELAVRFEAGYPELAAQLRGIADALGRIGL
jgi:hypothetical protein